MIRIRPAESPAAFELTWHTVSSIGYGVEKSTGWFSLRNFALAGSV